jgi:KAP family P-loop domain
MDASNQGSQVASNGVVIRDSTNAAIVIAVLPFKKTADSPPIEIEEVRSMVQWLIRPDGGKVPERSVRVITSSLESNGGVIGPEIGEIETAFRDLYDARSQDRSQNSLVSNRLYIVVIGPGFGDRAGLLTLLIRTDTEERLVGLELTGIANKFRDERLFNEVVLVADVPRFLGHQGSSRELKLGSGDARTAVQPAAYWYAFSNRFGARQTAETQRKRFVPTLLRGLDGEARDPHGIVDAQSVAQYLEREYGGEKDPALQPEFRSDRGPPILFSRPAMVGRAAITEGSDGVAAEGGRSPQREVGDTRIEPTPGSLGIGSEPPSSNNSAAAVKALWGDGLKFVREAGEDELSLNVEDYAKAVAQLYAGADDGEFCLAVFGPWGRGKTFLMRRVDVALGKLSRGYRTICFSAWRYPSAPEVWVHLYEEFAKAAFDGPWYRVMPNVVRTGVIKHGARPLLWAYALFAFGLIPLGNLFDVANSIVAALYPIVGVIGFILLVTIFCGIKRTKARLSHEYLTASRHSEKLGLQATIGADLRALLMGWIPDRPFGYVFTAWYAVITAALITAVMLRLAQGAGIEYLAKKYFDLTLVGGPLLGVEVGLVIAIAGFFGWVLHWLRIGGASPGKILLVVDDLDRCKPEHLLSVMESIKLLIEDRDVSRRVQVAMLLEEDVLKHAIFAKYGHLTDGKRASLLRTQYDANRLIWENGEKLFQAHLRLPTLAKPELRELIEKFSNRRLDEAAEGKRRAAREKYLAEELEKARRGETFSYSQTGNYAREVEPAIHGEPARERAYRKATEEEIVEGRKEREKRVQALENELTEIQAERKAAESPPAASAKPTASEKILEEVEIDSILSALDTENLTRTALGPRAIRAFIFRYQLARLLLNTLKIEWDPETLANLLASKSFRTKAVPTVQPVSANLSDAEKLQRVVDQVC